MSVPLRILILLLLIAGATASWWFLGRANKVIANLTLYGNVDIREVELAFRQPGRLETMNFDEGGRVRQGDLVAALDARPFREALAAAEAMQGEAVAQVEKLRNGNRPQDNGNRPQEIKRAAAEVDLFTALQKRLAAEVKRQTELATSQFTSQQELDKALSSYDEAAAGLIMAQQSHSLMQEGARQEDIRAAAASLAAAEAARAQAETALEDTRLLAPADGIILARILEPGSMVTPQTPVYTLALPNPIYIRAYAAETQLGQVAPGTPVRVTTDSSAKAYAGEVGFVSPRAEFTPKSVETTALRTDLVYRLRIVVPDGEEGLRQGMPVTVEVLPPAPHRPIQDGG